MASIEAKENLIYDWNQFGLPARPKTLLLDDETLRDGLQSPSVTDPTVEEKIQLLHYMDELQIDTADIGLPGAGPRAAADVEALAREIARCKLQIKPNCAARTVIQDIIPIAEISQKTGVAIEAFCFLGSSPIRQYTENWTVDVLLKHTEEAVLFAVKQGIPVSYVTEDTTRSDPETIARLYTTAIECGARGVVIADTCGHATPNGTTALVKFIRKVVDQTGEKIRVDWHGHRDRGMDLANSFAAWLAGADQVHGAAIGLGERVGNTPMDLLLVNLRLLGWIDRDLSKLKEYSALASKSTGVPIPENYPVMGRDAFRTATGVHAAAVIKAYKRNDEWLANNVYSGVPAYLFGSRQKVEIGPMSGKSNVLFWLGENGIEATEERVTRIYNAAKKSNRLLTDEEIRKLAE
jgi:isopropylmalate/homocitrate/citramalate synthase